MLFATCRSISGCVTPLPHPSGNKILLLTVPTISYCQNSYKRPSGTKTTFVSFDKIHDVFFLSARNFNISLTLTTKPFGIETDVVELINWIYSLSFCINSLHLKALPVAAVCVSCIMTVWAISENSWQSGTGSSEMPPYWIHISNLHSHALALGLYPIWF